MKILIVSGYFYPEITPRAFRTTELACELAREGHYVKVIAPLSGSDYTKFIEKNHISLQNITLKKQQLKLGNNKLLNLGVRIFNRLADLLFAYPTSEYVSAIPKLLNKETDNYDIVISIAQPHAIHWGINRSLKKFPKLTKKWIADCGDPYMGCKTDTFKKPFYFKYIEKSFCRNCDYITVPIKSAIPSYYPEFKNKIKIIPQGFNFSEEGAQNQDAINNPVPTFVFAGSFIPGIRDPRPLMDWLTKCNEDFRFYIFTKKATLVNPYKEKLGNKIIINNYISRPELLTFMRSCDFLLNLENGTSVQSPSKLIDYTLCKRPILSVNSNNLDTNKIKEFLKGDYSHQMPPLDISAYDIRNVAKQFIDLASDKHA